MYFQEIFEQHQITQKKKCTRGKRDLKFQQDHNLMAVVGMLVGFIFGIAVLLIYYIQTKEKLNFNVRLILKQGTYGQGFARCGYVRRF